jgi:hypothetical protein
MLGLSFHLKLVHDAYMMKIHVFQYSANFQSTILKTKIDHFLILLLFEKEKQRVVLCLGGSQLWSST